MSNPSHPYGLCRYEVLHLDSFCSFELCSCFGIHLLLIQFDSPLSHCSYEVAGHVSLQVFPTSLAGRHINCDLHCRIWIIPECRWLLRSSREVNLRPPSLRLEACTARCRASCSEWWSFFSCWFLWCNIQWPFCPVSDMWYWWLGHGNVWWIFLCLLPSSLTRHLSRDIFILMTPSWSTSRGMVQGAFSHKPLMRLRYHASAMVGMPKLNGRCTQGGLWLKDLTMRDGSAGTPFCTHQAADESGTVKPVYKWFHLHCVYIHIYIYTYIHTRAHTRTDTLDRLPFIWPRIQPSLVTYTATLKAFAGANRWSAAVAVNDDATWSSYDVTCA